MDLSKNKRTLESEENDVLNLFGNEHKKAGVNRTAVKSKNIARNKLKLILFSVLFIILFIFFINFLINQPRIKIKGDSQMTIEAGTEFVDPGYRASYYAFVCTKQAKVAGEVDTKKVGTYTLEYSITKGKKTKSAKRTVNVVDTTAPQIELAGESAVFASKWELYKEPGFTATDNCDGDVSSKVQVSTSEQDGNYVVTYAATDNAGNTSKINRTVTIKDVVAPEMFLIGKDAIWVELNKTYADPGVSAIDDLDGVITKDIKTVGNVDTSKVGEYSLTYTVSDKAGNKTTKSRIVNVANASDIPEGEQFFNTSMIYLTFDDGPSSTVTPKILDVLKKYNVKATFFICNYSEANKALVQRAVDEGHSIGIHGYTHEWSAYDSDEAYLENIQKLHDKLLKDTGYDSKIIRFLGGSSNTISTKHSAGIMTRLAAKVQKAGYQYFDWNVSSFDAEARTVDTATIISYSIGGLKPERNNIILMHDINTKTTTVEALPKIIEYGLANGYSFAGLTKDTVPVHHPISN